MPSSTMVLRTFLISHKMDKTLSALGIGESKSGSAILERLLKRGVLADELNGTPTRAISPLSVSLQELAARIVGEVDARGPSSCIVNTATVNDEWVFVWKFPMLHVLITERKGQTAEYVVQSVGETRLEITVNHFVTAVRIIRATGRLFAQRGESWA